MMRDTPLDVAWIRIDDPLPVGLGVALGLPHASRVYRKLASDGQLWAALGQDDHGLQLTVTHTHDSSVEHIVPGRLPTLVEVIGARVALLDTLPLMVLLLEPIEHRLLKRWGVSDLASTVGLPTTMVCVQTQIEDVTDDLVTEAPAPAVEARVFAEPLPEHTLDDDDDDPSDPYA